MLPRFGPPFLLWLGLLGAWLPAQGAPRPVGLLRLEKTPLEIAVVTPGLDAPIELAWGPDDHLWCTQLDGTVWRIDPATGTSVEVLRLTDVFHRKSHGLQSLAFHPQFATEPFVYLHYVYRLPADGQKETIRSRVVRCRWDGTRLGLPETLLNDIPGKALHNGSRLAVGPDGKLYVTTGDAGETRLSQNPASLAGKVLRLNLDGTIPADNPVAGSPVWTSGHRNPQGLVFAPNGRLYASEHGPNNDDEINLIEPGRNYGWPVIEGFIDKPGETEAAHGQKFTEPLRAWTPTIATAGLDYYDHASIPEWRHSLLLANLKGRALRVLGLNPSGDRIETERIFLQKVFGRVRDLCIAPNGDLYLITSNSDWHPRYQPWMYDELPAGPDLILRLRPVDAAALARLEDQPGLLRLVEDKEPLPLMTENWDIPPTTAELKTGQDLYMLHCAACHGPEGLGAPGLIPPLAGTDWVTGSRNRLIQIVLGGLSGPIEVNGVTYEQEMPAFRLLPDEDIAQILTYIRASFGNKEPAVTPTEVTEERRTMR